VLACFGGDIDVFGVSVGIVMEVRIRVIELAAILLIPAHDAYAVPPESLFGTSSHIPFSSGTKGGMIASTMPCVILNLY
jgi:hypothetical protein